MLLGLDQICSAVMDIEPHDLVVQLVVGETPGALPLRRYINSLGCAACTAASHNGQGSTPTMDCFYHCNQSIGCHRHCLHPALLHELLDAKRLDAKSIWW